MSTTPATILIVDDDWMNRELLQAHLESANYLVIHANNGQKGLDTIAVNPPDLILMDVRMPGLNGYETCAQIKANPDSQHIPILMMTAFDNEEAKSKGLEAGADDFLTKPYDMVMVLARVRSLLRIKALHDELKRRESLLHDVLHHHLNPEIAQRIMDDLMRQSST